MMQKKKSYKQKQMAIHDIPLILAVVFGFILIAAMQCIGETPLENNIIESLPESCQKDVYANLQKAEENQAELLSALAEAEETYLDEVAFLIANMPVRDLRSLNKNLLLENIEYACRAREETQWGKMLSHELFLNYVLPYANVTERRDNWRRDFYNRFMPLVHDCETASEAVLKLNTEVFRTLNVKYHARKRRKPDQSPYESMEIDFASCTGLSILLADACRARWGFLQD